jgi:hypothetical protein
MSRLLVLALVALLSLSPLMWISAEAQQGQEPPADATDAYEWPWEGVDPITEVPREDTVSWKKLTDFLGIRDPQSPNATPIEASLVGFRVRFHNLSDERNAYIPEILGAEFMVVIVNEGEFILDIKGPGSYLVDPMLNGNGDQNIEVMNGEISNDPPGIYYETTGLVIMDENGQECGRLCTVLPGFAVKLETGDSVIAPAGAICVWCLFQEELEGPATTETATPELEDLATGELLVFPFVRRDYTFSWLRDMAGVTGTPEATPSARQIPSGALRAAPEMAVLAFNPGPGCHRWDE